MNEDRWHSAYKIFNAAAALPREQRQEYLHTATADEETVRLVRKMLDELDAAPESDSPAFESMAGTPSSAPAAPVDAAPIQTGTPFGRFVITGLIGQGGMGRVYSAFDPQLNRAVAIKVLSRRPDSQRAADQLMREAQAASALNHPNIVTVFEVIESGDVLAIVMELVDGKSLRSRCREANPVDLVARWGSQIASALAQAHAHGVIHRDIKPENLMIRSDGYIKVLDFGLARRVESFGDTPEPALGTLGYMSPDQMRGIATAQESDIFSLGVVLYELATGVHPFAPRLTPYSTLAVTSAIVLEGAPAPSSRVQSLPPAFDALVLRMLSKDPAMRPNAETVARELEALPVRRRDFRRALAGAAVVVVASAVGVSLAWQPFLESRQPQTPIAGTLLTGSPGREGEPAFSPDGTAVAYAWDGGHGGKRDIWVKRIAEDDPLRLTSNPEDEWNPNWSPDGASIAFLREAGAECQVVVVPAGGGAERVLTTLSQTQAWIRHRLAWAASGQLVVSDDPPAKPVNLHLYLISAATGARSLLADTPAEQSDYWPRVSPDGRWVAFVRNGAGYQIRVIPITGGTSRLIVSVKDVKGLAWTASSDGILYQAGLSDTVNLREARLSGGTPAAPFAIEPDAEELAVSRDGRKAAYVRGNHDTNLWKIFRDGGAPLKVAGSTRLDDEGAWSPDGSRFVFGSNRTGHKELWVASANGGNPRMITRMNTSCGSPAWSPDGQWLAFDASSAVTAGVWVVPANGGLSKVITDAGGGFVPSWSRDGKSIYFCSRRSGNFEIWRVPVGGGSAVQITRAGGFESHESPDGKFLYYSKSAAGDIWRMALDGSAAAEEKAAPLDPEKQFRCWDLAADGIYLAMPGAPPQIDFLTFSGARKKVAVLPAELPRSGRCISANPDGQSFLFPTADDDRWEIYIGDTAAVRR